MKCAFPMNCLANVTSYVTRTAASYTAVSRMVRWKNVHATIPRGNLEYNQYTVSWHSSCRTYFCCFTLAIANIPSMVSRAILSNFFEKLKTTLHTFRDCRMHFFPTTFLEIVVYRARVTPIFDFCWKQKMTSSWIQVIISKYKSHLGNSCLIETVGDPDLEIRGVGAVIQTWR